MNKIEALEILDEAARRKARTSLLHFMCYTNENYSPQWFHKKIAEKCDAVLRGDIKKLMIFVPPQHGKSEIVSRNLAAYAFGLNPNLKIAECSYSADLAEGFSRDVQRKIESEDYKKLFPKTYLNSWNVRSNSKGSYLRTIEKFEIADNRGFYKAVGVCGPLTGNPVDIGIIDDPVKDSIEAASQTYRDRVWDWYVNVFKTRLHNNSREIIMMTRWNEDDLAGRLLKSQPNEWEVLVLQGILETENDGDPRKAGEALWEDKHSKERLLDFRKLNPQTFAALIQQDPKKAQTGGEFLKCWNTEKHTSRYEYNPDLAIYLSFDENVNPYFPCGIFQVENNQKEFYMIDCITAKNPNNTVRYMCGEIIRKLEQWRHTGAVYITGDATSQKQDVKQEKGHDLFRLIMNELQRYKPKRIVPTSNPSVVTSAAFFNSILDINIDSLVFGVDRNCIVAINDFENTKEDKNGKIDKRTVVDSVTKISYQPYGHIVDLTRYFICAVFEKEYEKYQGFSNSRLSGQMGYFR